MAAYIFRTSDLPKLDLDTDRGTDFQAWHQQWQAYCSLSGLSAEPAAKQVQALHLCFSRETLNIVENLGLTTAERKDQAQIIAALKRHINGRINETIERRNLRRRTQQIGETFDDYLVSLRELAKTCNFCTNDCLQKAIRDQIIEGLLDGEIIQELLQVKDLSLDQAITKCRGLEAAKKSRQDIQGTSVEVNKFQMCPPTGRNSICRGCGDAFHDGGRRKCPAFHQTCRNCGKSGHYAKVCLQKKANPGYNRKPEPNTPNAQALSTNELPVVQLSELVQRGVTAAPTVDMAVSTCHGSTSFDVLPDSGADICAAGLRFVKALGEHISNLAPSTICPRAVNGSVLHPLGKLPNVTFGLNNRTVCVDVHIYKSINGALISWAVAKQLGILPECYPKPASTLQVLQTNGDNSEPHPTAHQIMAEFPSVFDGQVRTMPGEKFHISLTEGARPFCVTAPRSIPFAYRDKLKQEIDLLVDQGIIAPVTEPTDWCAPIVVAPKKGTDRIRMCVDLSKLNKYVRREHYPSTTPAEAVTDIHQSQAKFFTVFDALKGYHQCPLDEASQNLTTFITPFGRFKYLRAPYGISSISEHYNRRMDEAFSGIEGIRKIVDDVVIFDKDQQWHVRSILQRCKDRGISLNRDKFKFCQRQAQFAGFILSSDGYSISNDIIDAHTLLLF